MRTTTVAAVVVVAALVAFAAALASAAAPPSCTIGVHQLIVDEAGASRYYECAAPNFVGYRDCPAGTVTGEVLGPLASDQVAPCSKLSRTVPGGVLPGMCNGQTGFVCKHDSEAHVSQFFWCAPPFFEGWQACPPGLYCETEGMHALPPCTTTVKPIIGTTSLTLTLDSSDPKFNRAVCGGGLSGVGTNAYYETRTLQVSAAGSLTITATHTGDGYIFLYTSFNPADAAANFVGCNDDFNGLGDSRIDLANIAAGTYTFVLTTFSNGVSLSSQVTLSGTAAALFV